MKQRVDQVEVDFSGANLNRVRGNGPAMKESSLEEGKRGSELNRVTVLKVNHTRKSMSGSTFDTVKTGNSQVRPASGNAQF